MVKYGPFKAYAQNVSILFYLYFTHARNYLQRVLLSAMVRFTASCSLNVTLGQIQMRLTVNAPLKGGDCAAALANAAVYRYFSLPTNASYTYW
jgi:hypothetical protein